MKEQEAINYLETLEKGKYITVNIPIIGEENIPVTAMYMGKDKENQYNFIDTGKFVLSEEFIKRGKVGIDKKYDGDKALEIYTKVKLEQERKQKRNRDAR